VEPWLEADEVESREQLLKLLEKELDGEDILLIVMGREDGWLEDGEVPGEVSKCMLMCWMLNTVAVIKINNCKNVGMAVRIYRLPVPTKTITSVVTSMLAAFQIAGRRQGRGRGNDDDGAPSDEANPEYGRVASGW
jgi:hypothetical protein